MNYTIENERITIRISDENGIYIRECSVIPNTPAYYTHTGELFRLEGEEGIILSRDFRIEKTVSLRDETEELLSLTMTCHSLKLTARICFLNNLSDTISIIFQFSDTSNEGKQRNYFFHSPFLASLHLASWQQVPVQEEKVYYPGAPVRNQKNKSVMQLHPLISLPLVITDSSDAYGLSVTFPVISDLKVAVQNRNIELSSISTEEELKNHRLHLRLNGSLSDVAEFSITGLYKGWREAFDRTRSTFHQCLDMSLYKNENTSWFSDTLIHHFTFLYSRETWDYTAGSTDISKLINDGNDFGGYDTLILWHQYPRLGVDQRSQWEFFHDFPNSIKGLASFIHDAHQQGVKVLLPYKPWDISNNQSMDDVLDQISILLRETDADGLFLDTMEQAPKEFRMVADHVKPAAIFCSEMHPSSKDALSLLTASWDQFWDIPCMPEIDLLRFILPEHISPQISRWQSGAEKDMLIKRAIFSGAGLVIWQDVFGTWLPYTDEQKKMIRQYKNLWLKYRKYFRGFRPTPLYPTKMKGLLCNRFSDADENGNGITGYIYTLYNDNEHPCSGALLQHRDSDVTHCITLWQGAENDFTINETIISGTITPDSVAIVLVLIN